MEQDVNLWEFFAGIGIFLFGMFLLEESIKKLSGRSFKIFIRKYTSNNIKGILTGTVSTAVLQSSSTVSLMVIAFAGAGILTFQNSIGVIFGSNLGTTFTTWIVATVGFKMKIEMLALPFIAVGGFGTIFTGKSELWGNVSKLLVGFGFIFLGLDYMKTSVEAISYHIDFDNFRGGSIIVFVLIGFGLTALIQSSSAASAITLSAIQNDLITFPEAAAIVVGSNMGTTLKIILVTIGKESVQKRIAFSHFIFNFGSGIVAVIFINQLNYIVTDILNLKNDPVIGLAVFHTIFNLMGVILFFPFINKLSEFLEKWIKDDKTSSTRFIRDSTVEVSEAAIASLYNETSRLLNLTAMHNLEVFGVKQNKIDGIVELKKEMRNEKLRLNNKELYAYLKQIQSEVFVFSSTIQEEGLSELESDKLHQLLHAIKYLTASAKTAKDLDNDFVELSNSENSIIQQKLLDFKENLEEFYNNLLNAFTENEDENQKLTDYIKMLKNIFSEEKRIVDEISKLIRQNKINEHHVNPLLSINRGITLSKRQFLIAVKEMNLDWEKREIFEKMIND